MEYAGFSDSAHTADGKYVIASFRADANLGWVVRLRSFLNISELKFLHYSPMERKQRVQANVQLYRSVMGGLSEAELTIIDRERYRRQTFYQFWIQGAEPGADFSIREINQGAADEMIRDSPLAFPVSDFPFLRRLRTVNTMRMSELPVFDPTALRLKSGGKLKDAVVLSARAHSLLSPPEFLELRALTTDPSFAGSALRTNRIAHLTHSFDVEHAKSLPLLNNFARQFARNTEAEVSRAISAADSVTEQASDTSDHIQASDFVAGWVVDVLTSTDSDYRVLAQKVRWMTVNGVSIPA